MGDKICGKCYNFGLYSACFLKPLVLRIYFPVSSLQSVNFLLIQHIILTIYSTTATAVSMNKTDESRQ